MGVNVELAKCSHFKTRMVFFRFRFGYFLAAFAVGIVCTYILAPPDEEVIKFPSLEDSSHAVYNENDTCFKFEASKVDCPENKDLIMT